jgi:serine/threonine protein kinase
MQRERWQQVSQIFEAALELTCDERAAYVKAQCGADEGLRREVEVLIESHEKANEENFINSPAVERAAPMLASDETRAEEAKGRLEEGQEIGHYRTIQKIGAGGMGEVYLAKDTRLDRMVALKILPADVAADQKRMVRFKQEARIVSSLNQPNIMTVFEFGETEGLNFIASEYIDGETLRQRMRGKQIKLLEIIDIGSQVTAALDVAHEAKIVHRDIKPENIMIRRRDALVKVLDFGLAKLSEHGPALGQSLDTEAATEALVKTMPGSVLGTINYMSPEQAQGLRVDQRTDIWSTGVVLYEMITGQTPFKGPTRSHTVVEILEREPPALTQFAPRRVPPELERIIGKALAKNPEERYQTAKDMLIDLKSLRRRLEIDAQIERSTSPGFVNTDKTFPANATSEEVSLAASEQAEHARSSRQKMVRSLSLAAALIIALVVGAMAWRSWRTSGVAPAPASVKAPERQFSYWMTVQKYRDGKPYQEPFRLAGEINFEKDYRVRLNVSSPQAGYLYILNEAPSGANSLTILFPSPTANGGSASLTPNRPVQIPEKSWFRLDQEEGTEKIWLVWSESAVPELEAVKEFANAKDQGVIDSPDLSRAVKAFIEANSASTPTVQKRDDLKETSVMSAGNVIVHAIKLEHH